MLSAIMQAISIKLARMVGHFLCDLDLDFKRLHGLTILFLLEVLDIIPTLILLVIKHTATNTEHKSSEKGKRAWKRGGTVFVPQLN